MSDECLMKQETVFSFYTQYQAVMRKFTLAGKSELDALKAENKSDLSFTYEEGGGEVTFKILV